MIKRLAIIILCSCSAFGAVCTSQAGGGNWDLSTAIWSCTHVPTTSDSVVIASGNNITVENGLTTAKVTGITFTGSTPTLTVASGGVLNAGTMVLNGASVLFHVASGGTANLGTNTATNTTLDITVTLGTFTIDNGGSLNISGSLKSGPTGTANLNGHTLCTPADASHFQVIEGNSSTTDSALLSFVGASHSSPAVFETVAGQNAGDDCQFITTSGSNVPKFVTNHAIFNRIGDASVNSITWVTQTTPSSISLQDFMLLNSGRAQINTNSGVSNASTFLINGFDIRNANATTNQPLILASINTTAPSSPRIVSNFTCDEEDKTGTFYSISVTGSNFNFGSSTLPPSNGASDTAGFNSLNCTVNMTGINNTEQNWFGFMDDSGAGSTVYTLTFASNNTFYNSAFYTHEQNTHLFYGIVSSSVANNSYSYNFFDGDLYEPGDSGSVCMQGGTLTCDNNITINGNGQISNTLSSPGALIMDNNLLWNQNGSSEGESVSNALQYTEYYDNLFPCPNCLVDGTTYPPGGTCNSYAAGANQENLWLTQTNFNEDYNWKYNFPNEGDPLSITCSNTNGVINFPFLGIFSFPNADYRGTARNLHGLTSTGSTGTGCPGSSCEFDYATGGFTSGSGDTVVQVNDVLNDDTKNTWTTINTVTSNTKVLVNNGTVGNMTTVASGDLFSISKGIWADTSAIGSATNRGLHDKHAYPIFYNSGEDTCTWYNSIGGALTCPTTIAGSGRSDTNILAVAHAAISVNGWDYGSGSSLTGTNCTSNCPQLVTPWAHTVTELLKYIGLSYRVYNGQAKNAGHSGNDVGPAWFTNYPATAMQSF